MLLERLSMAGKKVIVTGAGRGLGRQMALSLAEAGADIVCAARTRAQIEDAAEEIRALGREALVIPTDVADSDQIDNLVKETLGTWGQIDVFISNAGGGGGAAGKSVTEISNDDWFNTLNINLSSAFFGARAVVPHFRERGKGVIINVASGTGMRGDPRLLVYGTAKAGVVTLTQALAMQLVKESIRVNCIVPGFVQQSVLTDPQAIEGARQRGRFIPAGRLGEAWELGPLALYLASDASSYVTGEAFIIDGAGLAGGLAPATWDVVSAPSGGAA